MKAKGKDLKTRTKKKKKEAQGVPSNWHRKKRGTGKEEETAGQRLSRWAGPGRRYKATPASELTQQPQWEAWERAQGFVVAEPGLVFISVVNTF